MSKISSAELQKHINELLTTLALSRMFQVTEMTILTWRRHRGLPFIVIPSEGRDAIRYRTDDVKLWAKREGLQLTVPTRYKRERLAA